MVANFGYGVIKSANKLWPGKLSIDYVPHNWDYTDVFTKEDWQKVWADIKNTNQFWSTLPGYAENILPVQSFLWEPGCPDVYYITSRATTVGDSVQRQSYHWLNNVGIFRPGVTSIIPVSDPAHKNQFMQALKIKFSLDDYGPTVVQCNCNNEHTAYLLDRPWNRSYIALPRVSSMKEYLDIVRKG